MRSVNSFYNSILQLASVIISSVFGFVITNLIITKFGSDINGLLSTINQFILVLSLLDGGFGLATNVALYKPYMENDLKKINSILAATKKVFLIIGSVFSVLSIIVAINLPRIINTKVDRTTVIVLFLIVAINTAYLFIFETKYNIMFCAAQKEYVFGTISLLTTSLVQIITIVCILNNFNIILIRSIALLSIIIRIPILIYIFKKVFPEISFESVKPDFSSIRNTGDVLIQKISNLLFRSMNIIFISIFISTIYASVYAVYNQIFSIMSSIIIAFISAPMNGLGQLYAMNDVKRMREAFNISSRIIIILINILISTALILILPFIGLYTKKVTDINYILPIIPIMLAILCSLDLITSLFTSLLNSTGKFYILKRLMLIMTSFNIVSSLLLVKKLNIYGILLGNITSYVVILPYLIHYSYVHVLKTKITSIVKLIIENILISSVIIPFGMRINFKINSYFNFISIGLCVFIVVSMIVLLLNYIMEPEVMRKILLIVKNTFRQFGKKLKISITSN